MQFLPQEVDDGEEAAPGKMGKTSQDMMDCSRGQSTCGREDTHRGPFIQRLEKPHPVWEMQEVRKTSREAFGWGMVWKDA